MLKSPLHIEIVRSTNHGLSSIGAESAKAIAAVLRKHYSHVGITIVNTLADLEGLIASQPDLVFLGMKFLSVNPSLGAEDSAKIWIADYLSRHDIAFTGSDHQAHKLESDKSLAKQCVQAAGLTTAPFLIITKEQATTSYDIPLAFPLFIKPINRGGGQGIDNRSLAYTLAELRAKVQSVTRNLQTDALIESYLPGREFSVAILKGETSGALVAMPIELIAQPNERGARLLSREVKSSNAEQAVAVTDPHLKAVITRLALHVFEALGAQDYGRIDIRLDAAGTPHFLEANLIPSLISGYGSFPKACVLNEALDYELMIFAIAQLGLSRRANALLDDIEPLHGPILQYA